MAIQATTNRIASQGVWIGGGFGTQDDTAANLPLPGQVGMVVIKGDKAYQLVQFKSTSGAIVAGTPVLWTDFLNFVVSSTVSDSKRNQPAGMGLGAQTLGNFGWIQVGGNVTGLVQDGLVTAAGDVLVFSASDGQVTRIAAGTAPTYLPFAQATSASTAVGGVLASATVSATLVVPHNGW